MGNNLRPRPAVQRMTAYVPPTAQRMGKLRLDFNENTIGCSPKVAAFLRDRIAEERLATYPEYVEAKADLAAHFKVDTAEMLLTNGTDEAIQLVINTYIDDGESVIVLQPSYAMYKFYAELAGASIREIRYCESDLAFPLEKLLAAIDSGTRAILISNPNNPTGTAVKLEPLVEIIGRAAEAAVFVDEAYFEFCGITALPWLREFPNLFVTRTFSKAYGMAAMRLGCLFSDRRNLAFVGKAQSPYSVNMLAALAARVAISDLEYVSAYVREVLTAREIFYEQLDRLGIPYYRSEGNFVLLRLGDRAAEVRDKLRNEGILVRDRSHEIAGCLRVTVGTREQTKRFVAELERVWR